jgi:hypothetical protein
VPPEVLDIEGTFPITDPKQSRLNALRTARLIAIYVCDKFPDSSPGLE